MTPAERAPPVSYNASTNNIDINPLIADDYDVLSEFTKKLIAVHENTHRLLHTRLGIDPARSSLFRFGHEIMANIAIALSLALIPLSSIYSFIKDRLGKGPRSRVSSLPAIFSITSVAAGFDQALPDSFAAADHLAASSGKIGGIGMLAGLALGMILHSPRAEAVGAWHYTKLQTGLVSGLVLPIDKSSAFSVPTQPEYRPLKSVGTVKDGYDTMLANIVARIVDSYGRTSVIDSFDANKRKIIRDNIYKYLIDSGLVFRIVDNAPYAAQLVFMDGEAFGSTDIVPVIELNASLYGEDAVGYPHELMTLATYQLMRMFDHVLLDRFAAERNLDLLPIEREVIILLHEMERFNFPENAEDYKEIRRVLDPSFEQDKLSPESAVYESEIAEIRELNNNYLDLIKDDTFYDITLSLRPGWEGPLYRYIMASSDDKDPSKPYPSSFANRLSLVSYETILKWLRLYNGIYRYWHSVVTPHPRDENGIEYIIESGIPSDYVNGFMDLMNYRFTEEEFAAGRRPTFFTQDHDLVERTKTFLERTVERLSEYGAPVDMKDIEKIYIREAGAGGYKYAYQVIATMKEGEEIFEFALLLPNIGQDAVGPHFIESRETFWLEHLYMQDPNLVPQLCAEANIKTNVVGRDPFAVGKPEWYTAVSAEYRGRDALKILSSNHISDKAKKTLLRSVIAKYTELWFRMGGFTTIRDPKLENICSRDMRWAVIDFSGNELTNYIDDITISSLIGYAIHFYNALPYTADKKFVFDGIMDAIVRFTKGDNVRAKMEHGRRMLQYMLDN
ncbi:MAG TPA: hypothetical protein PLV52_04440, partial [Candidatus Omnitrophota bacterium]|nr:hypothetical protein [Candidatus Omnitrophota bacterium]